MITAIDAASLEAAIVRNGAPTLTGIMPANLFTFPGHFARADAPGAQTTEEEARENRAALLAAVAACAEHLAPAGIRLRVLVWRGCGALIYLYRPARLAPTLEAGLARAALVAIGYPVDDLEATVDLLADRIATEGSCATAAHRSDAPFTCPARAGRGARTGFPHEVGYLLGYPTEDVDGFIRHRGRGYLLAGPWKVYRNRARAIAAFERIHRSRARCRQRYRRGEGLPELAVACA